MQPAGSNEIGVKALAPKVSRVQLELMSQMFEMQRTGTLGDDRRKTMVHLCMSPH